ALSASAPAPVGRPGLARRAAAGGRAASLPRPRPPGAFDGDPPLVRALPRAAAARDDAALAEAVAAMLAAAGDPATRVVRDRPVAKPARKAALVDRRGGGLLVLTPDPAQSGLDLAQAERRGEITAAVAAAQGVIVDLRGLRIGDVFSLDFFDQLLASLPPREAHGPSLRAVVHSGYRPQLGTTSGGYSSSYATRM